MNRKTSLFAALTAIALALGASQVVAQGSGKPDPAKAKEIAQNVCSACHGADGNSAISINPNLAGQGADYITRQLQHFKSGVRANAIMQGMVATLTPDDMTALGLYFAQQKGKPLTAKDPALAKAGQTLYRAGNTATALPACSACHLPNGVGVPSNFPRVAGQHADYTYAQLKAFKAGERGNDKDNVDVNGKIMRAIALRMDDAQMKALADYSAGLR